MGLGRFLATTAAVGTVAGGALVVVGMAHGQSPTSRPLAERSPVALATAPSSRIPAQLPAARPTSSHTARPTHAATSNAPVAAATRTPTATAFTAASTAASTAATTPASTPRSAVVRQLATTTARTTARTTATPSRPAPPTHRSTTSAAPAPSPTHRAAAPTHRAAQRGVRLPVRAYTGSATRVITVKARATWSTTATLQAWRKAPGGGWLRVGSAATAHVGSDGLSRSPSESKSATPIGSFTLTQAFGYAANPGTHLHYFRTNGADWWISQSGPLYNTHQHCWSGCRFNRGSPNEHLYYERPYYKWAVVIDYNTRNSPTGVRQGAGSAFFLHVTDGHPTAGCVAIGASKLTTLMRWLLPRTHPRILIGTS